jgi:hypothetical protein
MSLTVQRTGYESVSTQEAIEKLLDEMYRQALVQARHYNGSLDEAKRLYNLREQYRRSLQAPTRTAIAA